MTDAILSFALENISKLLIDEANFLAGVSEQVKLLEEDLRKMLWFLKHADKKQSARENVQLWISEFRDIAYEANDIVEDYIFRVASRQQGYTNSLKRYACILSECHTRHKLGSEILSLRNRISNLTKKFDEYGVSTIIEGEGTLNSMQQGLRRTYSFFTKSDEDFVGMENDVDQLIKYLVNEGGIAHKSLVSIYGMGGIGKTTLAKKVYHHPRVRQQFERFAWFCISQQWKMKDILQGILVKLIPDQESQIMASGEENLVRQLHGIMKEKRCLIVLDDIWSNGAWDCIEPALCICENGSKILLTTRIRDVAVHADPNGYHHKSQFLTEEESWELLQKKALRNKSVQGEDYPKLEELGKKMVKHCGGLPLAIAVLGGILKTKENPTEWSIVHENIKSYFERGENIGQSQGQVQQILAFSYHDLPYQLKPCFIYLGKFNEDSDIEAERLYQLWMAEGMVLESDGIGEESMMKIAERYLEDLAQRCMVQVEMQDQKWPGSTITRFKSCRLHDLMRDLCLLKAKEENFFKVIDFQQGTNSTELSADSSSASSFQGLYRLLVHMERKDISKYVPPNKEKTKHMRSFWLMVENKYNGMPFPRKTIKSLFSNFKMLRVLIIEDLLHISSQSEVTYPEDKVCYHIGKYGLMDPIGNLIHLRYLGLRGSCFYTFPSSFGNLMHLETLDLSHAKIWVIPNVLWKMTKLKHVYFPYDIDDRSSQKLWFGGLSKLEILESFSNKVCSCNPKSLANLTNLRVFRALVRKKLEDLESIINHISNLTQLHIAQLDVWDCDFRKNSDKWSSLLGRMLFCRNLHELALHSTLLSKLPDFQPHFSPGLRELRLELSEIEEDPMATLEKLPNLQKLVLQNDSFVGKEMVCHAMGFPQLTVLELVYLPNLEKWEVNQGAMPKLFFLKVSNCHKLRMIPGELIFIPKLQIEIWNMPPEFNDKVSAFIDRVQQQYGERSSSAAIWEQIPSRATSR